MEPRLLAAVLPPPGHLRTAAYATLANTVGTGLWAAGAAIYLTRSAGLSVAAVGAGLSVAALVGLTASVPLGHLADRRDPRALRAALQLAQAVVGLAFLLVDSLATFLVVAVLESLLTVGNLAVRAALVAVVAGPEGRVHAFAALRAVANVGIGVGAALAAFALAADTSTGYRLLVAGNAVTYLVSAGLLMRLPAFPPPEAGAGARDQPARAALRAPRFLAVTGAAAAMGVHRVALKLIVPLWIAIRTDAPRTVISLVLVWHTVLSVLLAVRLGRGVRSPGAAARMTRRGGLLIAAGLLGYAATAGLGVPATIVLLLGATTVHTIGDLWHGNGSTGLAYELAPPTAVGQYQGAFLLLTGLTNAVGPALLTVSLLRPDSRWGWYALAATVAATGLAVPPLTRWAAAEAGRDHP
ncbi:MFS transporter [Catellatospora tritici]|uniref:MFS transporter n=1 Tax=Catellatospora tritici TaxID=2851566 RepID=UPI001C2D8CDA|nr:MFS transporter [Catellatospora tritici]MBV1856182.1 MFS transporter [Catellatospora tritici]